MPSRIGRAVTQHWESVVLHKSKPKAQELRDLKTVNQALRTGAAVQTINKFDAGLNARKFEEGTEPAALDRVSADVRRTYRRRGWRHNF